MMDSDEEEEEESKEEKESRRAGVAGDADADSDIEEDFPEIALEEMLRWVRVKLIFYPSSIYLRISFSQV